MQHRIITDNLPGLLMFVGGTALLQLSMFLLASSTPAPQSHYNLQVPAMSMALELQGDGESYLSSHPLHGSAPVSLSDEQQVETEVIATVPQYRSGSGSAETLVTDRHSSINSSEMMTPSESEEPGGLKLVSYEVKRGDSLTAIWTRNGGSRAGGILAARAFQKAGLRLSQIRAGETLDIGLSRDGDIHWLRKQLSNGSRLELSGNSLDGYTSERVVPEVIEKMRSVTSTVHSSISDAAVTQNVPYSVVDELVDLFGTRIEFRRDMQQGDRFTIFYSERESEFGDDLAPGPIESAAIYNRGHLHVAVRHTGADGQVRYYDEDGEPLGNFFLRYPVRFSRISSQFSKSRFHPVLKRRRAHNGVDFAAPIGTPVRSVADGVIVSAGYAGGSGNMVKIKHGARWQTAYLHLHRISKGIRKGLKVTRGQVIGSVGKTGLATGPHLHYSLYDRGRYVDPMKTQLPKMPGKYDPIPESKLKKAILKLEKASERVEFARLDKEHSPS